jgi:Glycosyltransferase family 87
VSEQPMEPVCQPPQTEGPMTLLASRAHDAAGIRALAARFTALVADARASGRLDMLARAFWLALIPGGLLFVGMQVYVYWQTGNIGLDSHAYWLAAREPDTWYTRPPAYRDAFLYSPAFGQVLQPLSVLPWPAFQVVWFLGCGAILAWLLAPLGWRRSLILAPFFVSELLLGNVYLLFAACLVLSLGRFPGAVALPVLTKVAPGVVGVWFVARREWRQVFWVVGTTAAIVVVSVMTVPEAWATWLQFLGTSAEDRGFGSTVRLVLAVVIVVWAARRNQAWLLAPALILACPVLGGYGPFAVLAAIPRLLEWQRAQRAPSTVEPIAGASA